MSRAGNDAATLPDVLPGHWETSEGRLMAARYAGMQRSQLGFGDKPDLALANAIFLVDRNSLDLGAIQQAAKERIRWLSVQLALANAALRSSQERVEAMERMLRKVKHGHGLYLSRLDWDEFDALLHKDPNHG